MVFPQVDLFQRRYKRELLYAGTEVRSHMRTNGFIFIALSVSVVALAGSHDYLPSVGPVGLCFAAASKPAPALLLPALHVPQTITESSATSPVSTDIPTVEPAPGAATDPAVQNPPVLGLQAQSGSPTNVIGPLIGPLLETNNAVTPQMFLRFFSPNQNGPAHEAVIVAPPGFSPAPPPPASSTATYSQPKP